ncbi:hypothetical protein HAX54_042640 [Datura stramonium]|uniref:Uncharacterized protein n=1 Tax=Datura stramonium TaxID=4076 RepID=A0ABS8RNW4_DATST|nr:hypothetical protein [Datura stramonium]
MSSEEKSVEFHYENLPYVCYYCEILGHTKRSRVLREEDVRSCDIKRDQFGAWMRAENHDFADIISRRQGNHSVRHPGFKNGKGKKITDCAEGTGSNEFIFSDDRLEVHRQNASNKNPPSFTPHEFFTKVKKGDCIEGDNSGDQNDTTTIQGNVRVIRKNIEHVNGDEPLHYEGREEVQKDKGTTVQQKVDNMVIDKPSPVTGVILRKSQQLVAADEPIFVDSIGGREERGYSLIVMCPAFRVLVQGRAGYYLLSKMGLGDTFDQVDIDRYYKKKLATNSSQSPPTAAIQTKF